MTKLIGEIGKGLSFFWVSPAMIETGRGLSRGKNLCAAIFDDDEGR